MLPWPAEAKLTAPGLDFASATRSFTLATGSDGVVRTRYGAVVIIVTACRSRTGS